MNSKIKLPKKQLFVSSILCFFFFSLAAQIQLEVEGNAKIIGKIELINAVGDSSVFLGINAGINDNGGNHKNVFIGHNSGMSNTTGYENTFIGQDAGRENTTGNNNIFIGIGAGEDNMDGYSNTYVGGSAGRQCSGSANTFMGRLAGAITGIGTNNVYLGYRAGLRNSDQTGNVFIGASTGDYASSSTSNSTLIGNNAEALNNASNSIAIGNNAEVACSNCAAIGGTGVDAVKVGIGTSSPVYGLDIHHENGAPNSTPGNGLNIKNLNGNNHQWQFYVGGANGKLRLYKNDTLRGTFDETSGNYVSSSDKRLKNNIQTLDNQLGLIQRLRPTTYQFDGRRSKRKVYGLIAQEVQKVLPDIVMVNEPDNPKMKTLGISYTELIPVLIAGMQEQQVIIEKNNKKYQRQQNEINQLKTEMESLKTALAQVLPNKQESPKNNSYTLPLKQKATLAQNQPNPFRHSTTIKFFIPKINHKAFIQITAPNGTTLGKTPISQPGNGQVIIQTEDYPTGTYYYSLVVDGQIIGSKKMILVK